MGGQGGDGGQIGAQTFREINAWIRLNNEATQLLSVGDCKAAVTQFQKVIREAVRLESLDTTSGFDWSVTVRTTRSKLAKAQACVKAQASRSTAVKINEDGNRLFSAGKCAEAVLKYREALQYLPSDAVINSNLLKAQTCAKVGTLKADGIAFYNTCKNAEAIGKFREALKVSPLDSSVLHWLGSALIRDGDVVEAITVLKKALTENSNDTHIRNSLDFSQSRLKEALVFKSHHATFVDTFNPWRTDFPVPGSCPTADTPTIRRKLAAREPHNALWRALAINDAGVDLLTRGDAALAVDKFREALQLIEDKIVRENLEHAEAQLRPLSVMLSARADTNIRHGEYERMPLPLVQVAVV